MFVLVRPYTMLSAIALRDQAIGAPGPIQMLPITVTVNDACKVSGLGRTKLYEAIKKNELAVCKVGTRTLIKYDQLKTWLDSKTVAKVA
ncbi:helix-turn-helix domain-containing protein [Bradyrhizobium sp. NP1]|uniref:excisionase family DNA-binding protein n=1 Tax=Bradyrhizobium sp. NP1 TaxID=3049772 RepID=UPI0025A64D18|nr:helix-turn-helix domain-containing protein [Bradyrhizobium sp. NP1]WJR78770.1 helix-turn-helix domain-containing protein [Bradyrhizobium sp. NP1]